MRKMIIWWGKDVAATPVDAAEATDAVAEADIGVDTDGAHEEGAMEPWDFASSFIPMYIFPMYIFCMMFGFSLFNMSGSWDVYKPSGRLS